MNNPFYRNRPCSLEEKEEILSFLRLEKECDEANTTTIEYMNRDHLSKTKSKQVDSAVKRWKKESDRLIKNIINLEPYSMNSKRNWYI